MKRALAAVLFLGLGLAQLGLEAGAEARFGPAFAKASAYLALEARLEPFPGAYLESRVAARTAPEGPGLRLDRLRLGYGAPLFGLEGGYDRHAFGQARLLPPPALVAAAPRPYLAVSLYPNPYTALRGTAIDPEAPWGFAYLREDLPRATVWVGGTLGRAPAAYLAASTAEGPANLYAVALLGPSPRLLVGASRFFGPALATLELAWQDGASLALALEEGEGGFALLLDRGLPGFRFWLSREGFSAELAARAPGVGALRAYYRWQL